MEDGSFETNIVSSSTDDTIEKNLKLTNNIVVKLEDSILEFEDNLLYANDTAALSRKKRSALVRNYKF